MTDKTKTNSFVKGVEAKITEVIEEQASKELIRLKRQKREAKKVLAAITKKEDELLESVADGTYIDKIDSGYL